MNVNKRQLCYIHLWVRYCLSDFYHQMVSASVHVGVCAHACFSDHSNVIRNTDHIHCTLLRLYIIMHQLSRHPRHKPSRELQRRTTGMTTELPGPQLYVSVQALVTLYILVYKINSCCLYIRSFSLLCKLKLKQIKKKIPSLNTDNIILTIINCLCGSTRKKLCFQFMMIFHWLCMKPGVWKHSFQTLWRDIFYKTFKTISITSFNHSFKRLLTGSGRCPVNRESEKDNFTIEAHKSASFIQTVSISTHSPNKRALPILNFSIESKFLISVRVKSVFSAEQRKGFV